MNLPDAIDHIRPSVIQFSVHFNDDRDDQPFGSGFILDKDGHIATAAHVVRDADALVRDGHNVSVGLAHPNLDNVNIGNVRGLTVQNCFYHIGAKALAADTEHDVAVLRLNPNPFINPPRPIFQFGDTPGPEPLYKECCVAPERPRDGEPIAVSGYPLSSPALVTTAGYLASAWETQISHVSVGSYVIETSADVYLADISVNPGNSGGPVYRLLDGCVIGVCTAYRFAPLFFADTKGGRVCIDGRPVGINAGLSVVAPMRHVLGLLDRIKNGF